DIKKAFWEWKRTHYPQTESSLDRRFYNLTKPNETLMQPVGVFGEPSGAMPGGMAMRMMRGSPRGMMGGMAGMGMAMRAPMRGARVKAPAHVGRMMAEAAAPMAFGPGVEHDKLLTAGLDATAVLWPAVQPAIRTNFADTAYWAAAIATAADGTAEVE